MIHIYKKFQTNTIVLCFSILLLTLYSTTGYAQINTVLNTQIRGEITAAAKGDPLGTYNIVVNKPAGATTINTIFVYNTAFNVDYGANSITLNGVTTPLNTLTSAFITLDYYCRYSDVTNSSTALVNTLNAAAAGSNTTIAVTESNYGGIDGVGILVLWNIPTNPMGTFVIQLGCLATGPIAASSSFAISPIDKTIPGFKATIGCGIGFSIGILGQSSVLRIGAASPTTIVSSNVGGFDDGSNSANGGLITLGGTGDSPTVNDTDELFDVAPFLSNGQTQISYSLLDVNSSYDDAINVLYFSGSGVLPVCNAGTTAPTLSSTTASNVCPTSTVNLTTITASNTPASTTLTWHTGTPATSANKVATPTAVAAGTYYAAFFDATGDCYSSTTTTVTATVSACCNAGSASPSLSATTISNVCPATTVNLTSITASNLPAGTTLTWHTGTPATTANKITGTAVAAGTYYAAFFDATNNCYSGTSGSATTAVTATVSACCNAGTAVPSLSATTISNVCPATTVNLTSITASNLPAGTTLTWHTGTPATTANKITGTAVAAGTYYAAFFDATNNCYSGTAGSATTAVTATVSACCNAGTAVPSLSATTISNVCPATTVNLTSITASNLPAGTTLTWHTGTPATTANKITGTAVAAGTYYAAFFDATNNCYSGTAGAGTTAVTATVNTCVTCNAGTVAPVLIKN